MTDSNDIIKLLKERKKYALYWKIIIIIMGFVFTIMLFPIFQEVVNKLLNTQEKVQFIQIFCLLSVWSSMIFFVIIVCLGLGALLNRSIFSTDELILLLFEKIAFLENKSDEDIQVKNKDKSMP